MDDAEIAETQDALAEILRNAGLGWVVEQANSEAADGHLVERIPERSSRDRILYSAVRASASKSTVRGVTLATEPFTQAERLQTLIRATRKTLVDSSEMAIELRNRLTGGREQDWADRSIIFTTDDSTDRFPLDTETLDQPSVERLVALLDQLAAEINR